MILQFENLTYNGFKFPVESKLEIDFEPNYDGAGRATVGVLHTVRVTATLKTDYLNGIKVGGVFLTGNNDADLPSVRQALLQPGQQLTLTGTGYGDLSVNGPPVGGVAQRQDMAWGPKPRRCSFLPLGTGACVLRWSCDVLLPACINDSTANVQGNAKSLLAAYNYAVSVRVDEQGYCTRTTSGYFEIAETRTSDGGPTVQAFAINQWGISQGTEPPIPPGFRRTTSEARESADKRRVDFTVTDAEMADVILPPNVVECKLSHSIHTTAPIFTRVIATLRGAYTMRKGVPKQDALTYFLGVLFNKWATQYQNFTANKQVAQIMPIEFTFEDPDVFGRAAGNFSATWSYLNAKDPVQGNEDDAEAYAAGVKNLIPNSALWTPGVKRTGVGGATFTAALQSPPGNTWQKWADSMRAVFGSQHPRFTYGAGDDIILGTCDSFNLPGVAGKYMRVPALGGVDVGTAAPVAIGVKVGPSAFLKYDTRVIVNNRRSIFVYANGFTAGAPYDNPKNVPGYSLEAAGAKLAKDAQFVGHSVVQAMLVYDIMKVGGAPLDPRLKSVGGVAAMYTFSGFHETRLVGNHFGIPVTRVRGWDEYYLAVGPGKLPAAPPNYVLVSEGVSGFIKVGPAQPNESLDIPS